MKKWVGLLSACLLFSTTAFAAPQFTSENIAKDTVRISGSADSGKIVTLVVLNPGYTYEDYAGADNSMRKEAVQYVGKTVAGEAGYQITFSVTGDHGGIFTVFTNGEESSFEYYNKSYKEKVIADFNAGEADYAVLVQAMGLRQTPLYTLGEQAVIESTLMKQKPVSADVDNAYNTVFEALLLSAYNTHNASLLLQEDRLLYADQLKISNTDEFNDYLHSLSTEGVAAVNKSLTDGIYQSCSAISEKLKELVYYNVIMNYKESGYGHIQGMFEKYEDAYRAAGVNFPKAENKNAYKKLLVSSSGDLNTLGSALSAAIKDAEKTSGSGGGGGGSMSSSKGFSGSPAENMYIPAEPLTPEPPEHKPLHYNDLAQTHWAYKAIEKLSGAGVISGMEDGSFAPEQTITRAEFTKMLAVLLNISGGDASFTDVSEKDWFAPYIKAAASKGFIVGADGKFLPNAAISRQDTAVILARALNVTADGDTNFTDNAAIAQYARGAVKALSERNIINGFTDGSFAPEDSLTRAEAAALLAALQEKGAVQ